MTTSDTAGLCVTEVLPLESPKYVIKRGKQQLAQCTVAAAGNMERAMSIASELCEMANAGASTEELKARKMALLSTYCLGWSMFCSRVVSDPPEPSNDPLLASQTDGLWRTSITVWEGRRPT